jgi:alpha-L-rhamnosidase
LFAHFTHTAVEEWSNITFSEDYSLLNGAQHCTRYSSLSNLQSLPTGCTQRERRGWTGDAQLSAEFTIHNFDMAAIYTKWMRDMRDTQLQLNVTRKSNGALPDCVPFYNHGGLPGDPAWTIAYPLITYWIHVYYDDVRIVAEHYEGIKAHLDNTRSLVENKTGLLTFSRYGDWCAAAVPGQMGCRYASSLVSTFYLILELDIVSKMAELLGYNTDLLMYSEEAGMVYVALYVYVTMRVCNVCVYAILLYEAQRRKDFHVGFYNQTTGMYRDGQLSLQTAQALALAINAVPLSDQSSVLANLLDAIRQRQDHLDTGIIGTKYLLSSLTEFGSFDLALAINSQTTKPGWGWWVTQDATTLWESWFASEFIPAPDVIRR